MDLLTAIEPESSFIFRQMRWIRREINWAFNSSYSRDTCSEGTSDDYFPPEVPALPAFALQKAVSTTIRDYGVDYWTGTVYTTNRRVWEHCDEEFKEYLQKIRAYAIDMETATIFTVGFYNRIPTGALLLVSDQPMIPEGVKLKRAIN